MTRKNYLLPAFLLCAAPALFAQTPWTTNGVLNGKHAVSAALGMMTPGGIERGHYPVSAQYLFEIPRVSALGGFQFTQDTADITLSGIYFFPIPTRHIRAGAGALYHAGWFSDIEDHHLISFQSDIIAGAYASFYFWLMYVNLSVAFLGQFITIPALPAGNNTIFQPDMALSVSIGGKILENLSAEFGIASYEMYSYHLFFNPVISFSLRYRFKTRFFEGTALAGSLFAAFSNSVQYSDMFTLSGHVEHVKTLFAAGYSF